MDAPVADTDVRAFLARARREALRYGDDPWILLRELVQNSRDAGATEIRFSTRSAGGHEQLECVDDGCGMSRGDIERYLLRLYASRKSPEQGTGKAARALTGKFGVGFWSVLRFEPLQIRVVTSNGSSASAVEVDCVRCVVREIEPVDPPARGTRVTLLRKQAGGEPVDALVRQGLRHWASHVRGVGDEAPPQIILGGETLNRPFTRPRLIAADIRDKRFDGVVGFGSAPEVLLYAHGFLVKEAGSLEELLPKRRPRSNDTPGLYPVCRLNADALEVLMDRSSVVEDALLKRLVGRTERRLARLRLELLDQMGPLPLLDKIRLKIFRRSVLVVALSALFAFGGGLAAASVVDLGSEGSARTPSAPTGSRPLGPDLLEREAPRISDFKAGDIVPWDIRVSDPAQRFLKIATFAEYDPQAGLTRSPPTWESTPKITSAAPRDPAVILGADNGDRDALLVLPIPTGGAVRSPVTIGGQPARVGRSARGEPVVKLPVGALELRYRFVDEGGLERAQIDATATRFPPKMTGWLRSARALKKRDRPRHLAERVAAAFEYSTRSDDARRFDDAEGEFLEKLEALGRGDCDVLNAALVLMLRAVDIPARLAVGFVVNDHEAAGELHAWVEHWDGRRWQVLDVTPAAAVPRAVVGARPATGSPPTAAPTPPTAAPTPAAAAPEVSPEGTKPTPPTSSPVSPASPSTPLRLTRANANLLLLVIGVVLGLSVLVLIALVIVLRRRNPRPDIARDDPALIAMLRQFLKNRAGPDPLHLSKRCFFKATDGSLLSVHTLDRAAIAGPILVSSPDCPALPLVVADEVLDGSDGVYAALRDLLPDAVILDELTAPATRSPDHPTLRAVAGALKRLDPQLAVTVSDRTELLEARVRSRSSAKLAQRHIVIGLNDPALPAIEPGPRSALDIARHVLARTTLFRGREERVLALVALEALA